MIFFRNRFAAQVFTKILILSSMVSCYQQTASPDALTVFKCVGKEKNIWSTLAQRGNTTYDLPILTWQTSEFGSEWTPEKRCHHVSEKLTKAVENNEGKLKGLKLTYGPVGAYTVICVVNKDILNCNSENMLFTLNRKNDKNPSLILAKIADFAKAKGTGSTILESGNATQFISLDVLVNRAKDLNDGL